MLGISDAMKEAFGQAALDTAIDSLTISKGQVDSLKDRKAEIEQELSSTTDEATRKGLQASLDKINEDLRSAEDQMLSDWENALEKANEIFEEKVKTALKTFTDAMAGEFKNIETLQDQFEKTRELDEYYVDDYKKIYELSKLTRDINRSIDETDNLASKQALRDIQQEINDLQEAGVEMSQYDLDHLRAKYELRLAEIALEDAQNAKSQVRMTRDSEGNWSYTYTADQQNIDQATQNYEDKLYKIQELSSNYIKDVESQIVELSTAMAEEISAIDRTAYASEEEYNAEVQRITDFYQTKMAILSGEMTKALDNNNVLYTQD
jgi:predicted  nucleic acid-binding Zn-ribbon protein